MAAAALLSGSSVAAAAGVVHVVRPGETLWSIAAKSDVYGDPLLWPLIYRWNRDQIGDPSRIYPLQELTIPTDVDAKTRQDAREKALQLELERGEP